MTRKILAFLTVAAAFAPAVARADDPGLDRNYTVLVPGEVPGLVALLAAAFFLWRAARRQPLLVRGLTLSLLSGVLLYMAFPPLDLGWVAWVALVPMVVAQVTCDGGRQTDDGGRTIDDGRWTMESAVHRPRSIVYQFASHFQRGNVYPALMLFMTYSLVLMHVFPSELPTGYPIPIWPFVLVAVALVALLLAWTGLPSGSIAFHRRTGFKFFILAPALGWMGLEEVRVITEAGQSWARIPGTQHANIALIQVASFGGQWLVGALVIAANYALALLLLRSMEHGWRNANSVLRAAWQPIAALVVVVGAHVVGNALISAPTQTVRVAAIQRGMDLGDSPYYMTFWNRGDWKGMDEAVLADFEPMIREAAARGAKVIALPEALLWEDPALTPLLQQRLLNLAKETGAYIAFTFYLWNDPNSRNEVYTATPSGQWLGPYAKNHPIAYIGEYSITAGQFPVYDTAFGRLSNFVCYDNAYTDVASQLAGLGASLLTSANHDWPEGAWGFYTQSIFRATENRLAIVRSDWRVGSVIIDPFGRVLATTKWGERQQTVLVADVPIIAERGTFYTLTGDWLAYIGLAVLLMLLLANVNWPRRLRTAPQPV